METNQIKTIVVLVELNNGNVHQVLTTKEQKQCALQILLSENGNLQVSDALEPINFKRLSNKGAK